MCVVERVLLINFNTVNRLFSVRYSVLSITLRLIILIRYYCPCPFVLGVAGPTTTYQRNTHNNSILFVIICTSVQNVKEMPVNFPTYPPAQASCNKGRG
jgi:hypothetical protein